MQKYPCSQRDQVLPALAVIPQDPLHPLAMNTHPRELPNHAEPSHAGHGDSRSLTPGIGATPGYHNALDQPTDAAKDCLEPNPAPPAGCPPSMPRFAKFGDELASAMSRAKEASRDGTGNAFTCPGMRATPGDQNALPESTDFGDCADSNDVPLADLSNAPIADPQRAEEGGCHAQYAHAETNAHAGQSNARLQTPGIRATPGQDNALEGTMQDDHLVSHRTSMTNHPSMQPQRERSINQDSLAYLDAYAFSAGPSDSKSLTPGIEATPGEHNASGANPADAIDAVECPANGGVLGFATQPTKKRRCAGPDCLDAKTMCKEPTGPKIDQEKSFANQRHTSAPTHEQMTHTCPAEAEAPVTLQVPASKHASIETDKLISVLVMQDFEGFPITCQVPEGTTAVQLAQAESTLSGNAVTPVTLMNTHIPLSIPLTDQQVVVFGETTAPLPACPFITTEGATPGFTLPCTRLQALWKQHAWVALDEMEFFLEATMVDDTAIPFPPAKFHNLEEVQESSTAWLQTAFDSCVHSAGMPWCSAAIVAQHWIPVIICQVGHVIQFTTTPEGTCFLAAATTLAQQQSKTPEIKQVLLPQAFPADCGFQSLAWLVAQLQGSAIEPLSPAKAAQWRTLFARELLTNQTAHQTVLALAVGGQLESHEMQQLVSLLSSHGVWPDRANERANQVVSKLSLPTLWGILKSPRPWQDLKAAANHLSPPLKLIMSDEPNQQIANRVQNRKYGKKSQAKGRRTDSHRDTPVLTAAEVQVPPGVFRQHDGTVLGPLHINEVGPNAKGILVLDQEDCEATLRLPTPVSQHGLAVIVLATQENAAAHQTEPLRFPALCISTQEPLIASGYMYQLGAQQVTRHEPKTKLAIEERQTETVRCLVYKDQAGQFWEDLQSHPVKHIFQAEPLLHGQSDSSSPVIDVWDRQWVSKKYEKVRPANAEVFIFSFRMNAEPMEELITKSGQNGTFWEPRSPCGRFPNSSYHVTWLQNKTFQDAKYAQQTSPQATSLARHGDRFGLRCDTMNAQEIHDKHRPNTPLLLGQSKTTYMIGPLPYSTTREALIKLLKAWEWDAKPLQPRGRSQDGQGVNWSILATEDPGHWVYSLQHGDVLVSKVQPEKPSASQPQYSIVASKKTIEHLQATAVPMDQL